MPLAESEMPVTPLRHAWLTGMITLCAVLILLKKERAYVLKKHISP